MRRRRERRGAAARLALGLVALGLVACPPPGAADPASHRRAAEAYVEVTRVRERMSATLESLKTSQLQALDKWYVGRAQRERAGEYVAKVSAIVARTLSWETLEDAIIAAHVRVFTEEELRALVAFYRTPLGAAAVGKRERLAAEHMDILQHRLREMLPELERLAEELFEEP